MENSLAFGCRIAHLLSDDELDFSASWRKFADDVIAPVAGEADTQQRLSPDLLRQLSDVGAVGTQLPAAYGGRAVDPVRYGLLTEEIGRACQSVRNFVAVQDMVGDALARWAAEDLRQEWLPALVRGDVVAAFALTEPDVGSDAASVRTVAVADGSGYRLRGVKTWISFAQIADVFLVFAQYEGRHTAFVVERHTPGISVEPIRDLLGLRASLVGTVTFDCFVPGQNLVSRPGSGLSFVASTALDIGRYSTAWGAVGLAQACLDAASDYAAGREQYGVPIGDHQLVRRLLADLVTDTAAIRLLCYSAGRARAADDPRAIDETLVAKYRSSTVAVSAAADAVQVHGAAGVGSAHPVQRLYRDAKVLEIIEGTTQIQQLIIGSLHGQGRLA